MTTEGLIGYMSQRKPSVTYCVECGANIREGSHGSYCPVDRGDKARAFMDAVDQLIDAAETLEQVWNTLETDMDAAAADGYPRMPRLDVWVAQLHSWRHSLYRGSGVEPERPGPMFTKEPPNNPFHLE